MFNISEDAVWRTVEASVKIIETELRKYKHIDMMLSEREIAENKKITAVLESLILKIKELDNS